MACVTSPSCGIGAAGEPLRSVLARCAMSAATAWGFYLMARFANHRWHMLRLEKEADNLRETLQAEREQREAERKLERSRAQTERQGRIRAEQELRRLQLKAASVTSSGEASSAASPGLRSYPVQPIGIMQSCFSQRNGTPRQPLLAVNARSRLRLAPDVPPACLEGLQLYSHVWVLYIFHENTDLAKLWQGDRSGVKAKIHVPRLNGEKMGVFATRSPHRPTPIGLSVAQVIGLTSDCLVLGGADIVDGTPVLDIKPYLPFVDSVPDASAPCWVAADADEEPLAVSDVKMSDKAEDMIMECWSRQKHRSLYNCAHDFLRLVSEVLSRDIRPVHRRMPKSPLWEKNTGTSQCYTSTGSPVGQYHVVLENIDVSYDIDDDGKVTVLGGMYNVVQSQQRGMGVLGKDHADETD